MNLPFPGFQKELLDVAEIFLSTVVLVERPAEAAELYVRIMETVVDDTRFCAAELTGSLKAFHLIQGQVSEDPQEEKRLHKRQQKTALFHAFVQATGRHPPWGSLTGVRPTRLVYEGMEQGLTPAEAAVRVGDLFHLRKDKAELLQEIVLVQQTLPSACPDEASLYVGIPFCPSRCRYCSFISSEVGDGGILPSYVDALKKELEGIRELMDAQGLKPRSVYVGGGTPTVLPERMLLRLMKSLSSLFGAAKEVTVEAGRPDSITKAKLGIIRDFGSVRISVNPQTMFNQTLERIGRRHTREQTEQAYALARSMGYQNINMDLIAGLPGETPEMFSQTVSWALNMKPESVTVHTLSVKRSSDMYRFGDVAPSGSMADEMLDEARVRLTGAGYRPYYLYRQKHMAGNLENVGYAKPGSECLYNIDMMEDATTVLAAGANAISKLVSPGRKRILRAPNIKDAESYIMRIGEMIERKNALFMGVGKGARPASGFGPQADVLSLELEDEA